MNVTKMFTIFTVFLMIVSIFVDGGCFQ